MTTNLQSVKNATEERKKTYTHSDRINISILIKLIFRLDRIVSYHPFDWFFAGKAITNSNEKNQPSTY